MIYKYLIFISFVLCFEESPDWIELHNNNNWNLVKQSDRITLYTKKLSSSPLPAYRIELISTVDKNLLINTAWEVENSLSIFPNAYIVDAGVYSRNKNSYSAYQVIDIPILSPRLYQFNSIKYNDSIHWVKRDTINTNFNLQNYILPPVNFGSWSVISINNNTKLTYRLCTNPGGTIPIWVIEQANKKYLPQLLLDLENFIISNKLSH